MTDPEDALFEDMQALSNDAETLGLTDVALVLKFAMDVYLYEKATCEAPAQSAVGAPSEPTFILSQFYRQAS